MNAQRDALRHIVILADETANWKIGGLRQLDRLTLELNEYFQAKKQLTRPKLSVFWRPDIPAAERCTVFRKPIAVEIADEINQKEIESDPNPLLLSTRLFPGRNSFAELLEPARSTLPGNAQQDEGKLWQAWFQCCEEAFEPGKSSAGSRWRYLTDQEDISQCEEWLLRQSSKSQDGVVSRFINRPLSRYVTRLLLKLPVTPTAWTLMIFIFPLCGVMALTRGDYWSFVAGTLLFQLYSILDGCDGEIARAKYLESERGKRLDNWCDHASIWLLVICLGIGLFRDHTIANSWRAFYFIEGLAAAILLATNEVLLVLLSSGADVELNVPDSALYQRHRGLMRRSEILELLAHMTKRDVALFVFVLLAVANRPQWIVHLLSAFGLLSSLLAAKALISARTERDRLVSSRSQ